MVLKLALKAEQDNIAQVLLEPACRSFLYIIYGTCNVVSPAAYERNSDDPVYAVLTDLQNFYFFILWHYFQDERGASGIL